MCERSKQKVQTSQSCIERISYKSYKKDGNVCNSEVLLGTVDASDAGRSTEYYKKYEHDELPVKDTSTLGDKKHPLTNHSLDQLEMKIFKNMSKIQQTDEDFSRASLESNIKLFKSTVQEIFDIFNTNMRDFERFKKRFDEILAKDQEDIATDMEDFIKDMLHHINLSESFISSDNLKPIKMSHSANKVRCTNEHAGGVADTSTKSVIEAFRNDQYLTDSTEGSSNRTKSSSKEDIYNIILVGGNPCVAIKMRKNLLSEINIRKSPNYDNRKHNYASVDNINLRAAKKLEVQKYVDFEQESNDPDQDIPVKVSFAKKDIHLDEDFICERESVKSMISRICNFLCKRFRKSI